MWISWLDLLWAVPFFFLVTLIHELAHAAGVWVFGGQVLKILWWPHSRDQDPATADLHFWQLAYWKAMFDEKKEHYFFGRIRWRTPRDMKQWKRALISLAPFFADLVGVGILLALGQWKHWALMLIGAFSVDFVRGALMPLWSQRGDLRAALRHLKLT